jgi:hypothetical protein
VHEEMEQQVEGEAIAYMQNNRLIATWGVSARTRATQNNIETVMHRRFNKNDTRFDSCPPPGGGEL